MRTIRVCKLPISIDVEKDLDSFLLRLIDGSRPVSFHGYSIDTLHLMKIIPNLFQMREANDYFLCDGRGFFYFMKLLGVKGVSKLSLPALTMKLVALAAKFNKSTFILGATEESNRKAIDKLVNDFGVSQVQGRNGYYSSTDESSIVEQINKLSPDILFLGMSSPKKDEFVYRWKDKLNVKIIVHCGGMIDVISGKTRIYPKWVKDFCLAGIFRFVQEPIRLRRDFLSLFPSIIIVFKMLIHKRILITEYNYPLRELHIKGD